jgi:mono/diheme cytochrome c family protein
MGRVTIIQSRFSAGMTKNQGSMSMSLRAAMAFTVISLAGCALAGEAMAEQQRGAEATAAKKPMTPQALRGRYLVQTSGCNDCHTAGYGPSGGKVNEKDWLTGDPIGFRGPWGTTYAANLRLVAKDMTEAQWIARARSELRPPMPWFNLRAMTDADVKAIYAYLRQAGPAGAPAPSYVPPDKSPTTPVIQFPGPPPAAAQGK